jgi:hypothetical protein
MDDAVCAALVISRGEESRAGLRTKMQWAGLGAGLGIGSVALLLMGAQGQPPAIPDAPAPRISLPTAGVKPGAGTTSVSEPGETALPPDTTPEAAGPQTAPATAAPAGTQSQNEPVQTPDEGVQTIHTGVYEVNIPFTVKDGKGAMVPNIRQKEIQVFENGRMMRIVRFVD